MKKLFKRKNSPVSSKRGADMETLMHTMQEQLASLERKLDTVLDRVSQRAPEKKHFPESFQRFDRPHRHGKDRRDNDYRGRNFSVVICADCQKECEVPFKPTGDRPVYCKECFAKRKGMHDHASGPRQEHFDGGHESRHHRQGKRKKHHFQ